MNDYPQLRLKEAAMEVPPRLINPDDLIDAMGVIAARTHGQFKDRGIYLSEFYEWVIGYDDDEGQLVLLALDKD
jgi:hypothetical protein